MEKLNNFRFDNIYIVYSPLKKYILKLYPKEYNDLKACLELYTYSDTNIYAPIGN